MVLVALGTIGKAVAKVAYDGFDDIQVLTYNDLNDFMRVVNMHTMEIHRMIISENAFDLDIVTDEVIESFVNLIQVSYPAAKLITVSKDREMTNYFAQLLMGIDYVHICIGDGEKKFKATHKFLEDLISLPTGDIKSKYKNIVFNREISVSQTEVDIIDNDVLDPIQNSEVEGYVQNPHAGKEPKRSLFDKILGRGPRQNNNQSVIKQGGQEEIGYGFGVQEFSTDNTNPFDGEDGGFSMFDSDENDVGLGFVPSEISSDTDYSSENEEESSDKTIEEIRSNIEKYEKENSEEVTPQDNGEEQGDFFDNSSFEDDFVSPKPENDFNSFEDGFNTFETNEPNEPETQESSEEDFNNKENENDNGLDIPVAPIVPPINLSQIRDRIESTNLNIDMDNIPKRPSRVNKPLDVVENEDLDGFGDNFTDLMQNYEESNRQIVEKKVVETKYVTVGNTSKFRNKNGVRIIVLTGDRRVGTTKLALNLCAKFARNEKVLYVDFDRYRHGSLGYLDLEGIMDEPDHVSDGLNHYRGNKMLKNVVHIYNKGNFYTLTSMYGSEVTDEQLNSVEKLLVSQNDFQTVVIDCPIENMYLLDDILRVCNVVICAEDEKVGVLNLLTSLGMYSSDAKQLLNIFEKSSFVVDRKNNIEKFTQLLAEVVDLFDMEEAGLDWTKVEVIGTTKNVAGLAERMSS